MIRTPARSTTETVRLTVHEAWVGMLTAEAAVQHAWNMIRYADTTLRIAIENGEDSGDVAIDDLAASVEAADQAMLKCHVAEMAIRNLLSPAENEESAVAAQSP